MFDYVVVGAGIGGASIGAILSALGKDVLLLEKLGYVGGCAGTFERNGYLYNVGAATFVGLKDIYPVGKLSKILNLEFDVKELEIPMKLYVSEKEIIMWQDKNKFFEELRSSFGKDFDEKFWDKVLQVSSLAWENLWNFIGFYPSFKNIFQKAFSSFDFLLKTFIYNLLPASFFVKTKNKDYISLLNSQSLITTQSFINELPFLPFSLGASYTLLDNYYVYGGMGKAVEKILSKVKNVRLKEKVIKVKKVKDVFLVKTNKNTYETKNVILNKTVWDAKDVIDDSIIKAFSDRMIERYNKKWSAITVYFMVEDVFDKSFEHHHQILLGDALVLPGLKLKSFFVSISDKDDKIMNKNNFRSVTISAHTRPEFWENLPKERYLETKERVKDFIFEKLYEKIPLFKTAKKIEISVGTPLTFKRYTDRFQGSVGGIPISFSSYGPLYPFPTLPLKGLYLIGDTVFPGQGWPGVVFGSLNLAKILEKDFSL